MRCDTLAGLLQLKIFLHPLISKHRHAERQGIFILTNMKTCTKCNIEKETTEFTIERRSKDGLRSSCKECEKQYYLENKEKISKKAKKYRLNNKEKIKQAGRQYQIKNKEKIYKYLVSYAKRKREEDPIYRFNKNTRALIYKSFKRGDNDFKKNNNTENILGCSIEEFKHHLESQFTEGMILDNYGEWHLDHIIPISSAKTEEEIIKLNHYTNFQPLWSEDNLKKGNKFIVSL